MKDPSSSTPSTRPDVSPSTSASENSARLLLVGLLIVLISTYVLLVLNGFATEGVCISVSGSLLGDPDGLRFTAGVTPCPAPLPLRSPD